MHLRRRNDVIAIKIMDKRELKIPNIGLIELEDEETGEQLLLDTSDEEFRIRYSKKILEENKRIDNIFNRCGVDKINLSTDAPYYSSLKHFFAMRRKRQTK
jgi:uncharacterized protein (DUF58 family)